MGARIIPRPSIFAMSLIAWLVAALAGLASPAHAGQSTPLPRPFAPDSVWNAPLAADQPLDPNSTRLVAELVRQEQTWVPWMNTTQYSEPVYVVPADQPTVPVRVDPRKWWAGTEADSVTLQRDLSAVPIPPGARPARGTDRVMLIWQPSTDTMWELLIAHHVPDDPCPWHRDDLLGWHAAWGAKITNVSQGSGVVTHPFGASSSGLALAGGLIGTAEIEQGHIHHAMAMGLPQVKRNSWVAPATRTDGRYAGPDAIAEGQRFRLDPRLDIASLHLPPITRMVAEAAQRYGFVVRDASGAVSLYAQDPSPSGFNPYPSLFGGMRPDQFLARFPWTRLQAVASGPDGVAPPAPSPGPGASSGAGTPARTGTPTQGTDSRRTAAKKRRSKAARRRAAKRRRAARARARAHRAHKRATR